MRFTSILLAALASTGLCFGWGGDGHKIVCEIAWLELSPEARTKALELLGAGETAYRTFNHSCTWADRVRREDRYERDVARHFVNGRRGAETLDLPCDGPCIVEGIEIYRRILAGEVSETDRTRSEALKFLTHFVGDVHQPLHAGYADDLGGNLARVRYRGESAEPSGKPYNLHRVWDTLLIRDEGKPWKEYAVDLHQQIAAFEREAWTSTMDPGGWARESFVLARGAYETGEAREIGPDYHRAHIGTVEMRLKQAGVRLARLLERSF